MRSLLSLWLLCLYTGFVTSANCDFKMPTTEDNCVQTITYRVHSDAEATETCKDFFPTNFVKGVKAANNETIECTVERQFQCDFIANSIPMHDKCYTFHTSEVTIDDYHQRNPCTAGGGALPVPFSMSQTKFIAMEAHRKGISRMWMNVDNRGKTIEKALGLKEKFLLYSHPWKVYEDQYWDGDTLKTNPDTKDRGVSVNAKHLFFRTRTDYEHNLMQGSFERTNNKAKASVVCEFQAKIIPKQGWYCEKMKAGLGMKAEYDKDSKKCVYTTLMKYSLMGDKESIQNFIGCRERPSNEHSVGLDDGTANKWIYDELTKGGTYRVAAIKTDLNIKIDSSALYEADVRKHCNPTEVSPEKSRQPYSIFDTFLKARFSRDMQSEWAENYPKDECTDFSPQKDSTSTLNSNTLAIRKGKIIDVPTPVRLRALCTIASNVDCGFLKNPCRKEQKCVDVGKWKKTSTYEGFLDCECPKYHLEENGKCKWEKDDKKDNIKICGAVRDVKNTNNWEYIYEGRHTIPYPYEDNCDRLVVREGCKVTMWSHPFHNHKDYENYKLLTNKEFGEYELPNDVSGTLNGWHKHMSATSSECSC